MMLIVAMFIALLVTVMAAGYFRFLNPGANINRRCLVVIFAGALIIINTALRVALVERIDLLDVGLILFGLLVEFWGTNLLHRTSKRNVLTS